MSDKPKAAKKAKAEPPKFDASLGRLEEIVAELEQGGLGLEESLAQYKEGVTLLKGCREQLAGFRAQVEELTADGMRPHDRDPDAASGAPASGGAPSTGSGPANVSELDTPF
ncbi:MAG: exodeoxyribonuclease VII small subunit [Planctomycetota bacterium]